MATPPKTTRKPVKSARAAALPSVSIEEDVSKTGPAEAPSESESAALAAPPPAAAGAPPSKPEPKPDPAAKPAPQAQPQPEAAPAPAPAAATVAKARDVDGVALAMAQQAAGRATFLAASALFLAIFAVIAVVAAPFWTQRLVVNDAQTLRVTGLAVAQLVQSGNSGNAFARELALVRATVPNFGDALDDGLAALVAHAGSGKPTLAELRSTFTDDANALVVSRITGGSAQEWLTWTANKLATAVRLDPLISTVGAEEAAREIESLRRVEAALRDGDVARAISLADALPADIRAGLADWRAEAQRHLAIGSVLPGLVAGVEGRTSRGMHLRLF